MPERYRKKNQLKIKLSQAENAESLLVYLFLVFWKKN